MELEAQHDYYVLLTDFGLGLAQDKEPSSAARHLLPRSPLYYHGSGSEVVSPAKL